MLATSREEGVKLLLEVLQLVLDAGPPGWHTVIENIACNVPGAFLEGTALSHIFTGERSRFLDATVQLAWLLARVAFIHAVVRSLAVDDCIIVSKPRLTLILALEVIQLELVLLAHGVLGLGS